MPGPHPAPLTERVGVADAATLFRALHDDFLVVPNPWDGLSAKLAARAGFKAVASSSAAAAWGLGLPDGTLTAEMAVAHAAFLSEASGLPVNGDFESGYGTTPDEVAQTMQLAIERNIAGCSIEDLAADGSLYEAVAATQRLEAAREAIERAGSDVVLAGRCEALKPMGREAGLAEAVRRIPDFVSAGADVIYVPYLKERDEVQAVLDVSAVPVSVIAGLGGISDDLDALREMGVRRITFGSGPARIAYGAYATALEGIATGRAPSSGGLPRTELTEALAVGRPSE